MQFSHDALNMGFGGFLQKFNFIYLNINIISVSFAPSSKIILKQAITQGTSFFHLLQLQNENFQKPHFYFKCTNRHGNTFKITNFLKI